MLLVFVLEGLERSVLFQKRLVQSWLVKYNQYVIVG